MGVLTTGLPAAMYSTVLVGLMYFVESLRAKGRSATSHPERNAGSAAYGCCPV